MATWPATLPQKQFLGLSDQDVDPVVRTPMDNGPPTRRRRFACVVRNVDVALIVNGTQRQAFDSWFHDTIDSGATAFDWEDPVTDETVSFAFRSPPKWTMTRGGTTETRIWTTTLQLEIQPS